MLGVYSDDNYADDYSGVESSFEAIIYFPSAFITEDLKMSRAMKVSTYSK